MDLFLYDNGLRLGGVNCTIAILLCLKLSYKHVLKLMKLSRMKAIIFRKENTPTMGQCSTFSTYY